MSLPLLGCYTECVGDSADGSEVHVASILRVEVCALAEDPASRAICVEEARGLTISAG
jgi:hypothetical protein